MDRQSQKSSKPLLRLGPSNRAQNEMERPETSVRTTILGEETAVEVDAFGTLRKTAGTGFLRQREDEPMTLTGSRVTVHLMAGLDGCIARRDGRVDWMETSDEFDEGEALDPECLGSLVLD